MKLVFASDSLKGSLSSKRAGELLRLAAENVFGECETIILPIADGGEGTMDAVLSLGRGEKVMVPAHDPLNRPMEGTYVRLSEKEALIEMAAVSGLTLLSPEERNPLFTTTCGVGELIRDALKNGCNRIIIAIGGSATNDGGMGCMQELGIRFRDVNGTELSGAGKNLVEIASIDTSGILREVKEAKFTGMCDVTNPLCGKNGATMVYGPQKGGTPEILQELEAGMVNFRDIIRNTFGMDCDHIHGAGAAGGLGAALKVFLGAEMRSGIQTLLDLVHFDDLIRDADLIVTGEGRADAQSCQGKVMQGIGLRAVKCGIPVYGLCGTVEPEAEALKNQGITALYSVKPDSMPLQEAMERAEELYLSAAEKMFLRYRGNKKKEC